MVNTDEVFTSYLWIQCTDSRIIGRCIQFKPSWQVAMLLSRMLIVRRIWKTPRFAGVFGALLCKSHATRRLVLGLLVGATNLAGVSAYCQAQRGPLSNWWQNGCKVGPNYARPAAPIASEWIDYATPKINSREQPLAAWWTVFNDPTLNRLIQTAYQQNLTLRTAGARILEARAQLGIARGELFPQEQSAFAQYSRNKLSDKVANPPLAQWFSQWDVGLTASWELDFWGRFRRAIEAADAELDASVEDYDDVLVILLSDVAANYIQYRTFEQRIAYARTNVEIQRKSFEIATDRFTNGATTERDTQQSKQVVEQTEALIPVLEIGKRQAANRLCVLLGMPPTNMEAILGAGSGVPVTPLDVIVGVPCDLLRRRPDVRRAERQVAAQTARIGVAVSDLYPHFSLLGTIGLQAEHFGDLFDTPGSMIGNITPGVRWDILNYGRLVNNVRVQDARFQAARVCLPGPSTQCGPRGRRLHGSVSPIAGGSSTSRCERRGCGTNCSDHRRTVHARRGRFYGCVPVPNYAHRAAGSAGGSAGRYRAGVDRRLPCVGRRMGNSFG